MTIYFTNLQRLRDELGCLRITPIYTCESAKLISEIENGVKVIQFLMGLNDSYSHFKDLILIMDQLPNINSMVLSIEKQREVHSLGANIDLNHIAMSERGSKVISQFKRWVYTEKKKKSRFCSHCSNSRHSKDTCFKIHGYP